MCEHRNGSIEIRLSYSYEIQEEVREQSCNDNTSYQWRTVDQGAARTPFRLTDASGSVSVDPERAHIDAPVIVDRAMLLGEGLNSTTPTKLLMETVGGEAPALVRRHRRRLVCPATLPGL